MWMASLRRPEDKLRPGYAGSAGFGRYSQY